MPMQQLTPMEEIDLYTEEQLERLLLVARRTLFIIGERCINKARRDGDYTDRTSNMRSSIGYVVSVDGKVINQGGFQPINPGGTDGSNEGLRYARELARKHPHGMYLIVVVGMQYAAYVSAKGYDVIDGAELLAEELSNTLLKQLDIH